VSTADEHAADRLIRELIASGRGASPDEIAQIVERMATAPFNPDIIRVPVKDRGSLYEGHALTAREQSITYHLTKRVMIERQWAPGTSAADYLTHQRSAVRYEHARLAVYERGGEPTAVTVTPTAAVLISDRLGARPLPNLLVVYSALRSIIRTGYQFSQLDQTTVPPEALWLS
jgi:hypothetical protein